MHSLSRYYAQFHGSPTPGFRNTAWRFSMPSTPIKLTELLATMRSLDLFSERELSRNLGIAIRNKIIRILEPPVAEPVKAKPTPKPPLSVTRVPQIERAIAMGVELLALRSSIICNKAFGARCASEASIRSRPASP